jgi:glycosyltransferase involved in cell wall biosynthesis
MARVDIVMPLYNKQRYVSRAIESIRCQTIEDWKLIVIDDGSTDNGPDVVRSLAENDHRITLTSQKNQGAGPARNAGIAQADSKHVAFLDADDEWYPWYLANSLEALETNDVAMVASMYYQWPEKWDMTEYWAQRNVVPGKYTLQPEGDPYKATELILFLLPWNCVLLTEVARKYGGYCDCIYGEDRVFFIPIAFCEKFVIIEPPAVRWHVECSGIAKPRSKLYVEEFLLRPEVILKHCPADKYELMQKFLGIHALLTARRMSSQRQRLKALKLLFAYHKIMPRSKEFTEYLKMLVPGFFTWSKIKKSFIKPARRFLGRLTGKSQPCDEPMTSTAKTKQQKNSHLVCEPPLMPYENNI